MINPLRRTALRPKAKKAKTSWRNPERVRLGNGEMSKLRSEAFERADGRCENVRDGKRCPNKVGWFSADLHHIKHRSAGGGDVIGNVMVVCWPDHRAHHDQGLELEPCWK